MTVIVLPVTGITEQVCLRVDTAIMSTAQVTPSSMIYICEQTGGWSGKTLHNILFRCSFVQMCVLQGSMKAIS